MSAAVIAVLGVSGSRGAGGAVLLGDTAIEAGADSNVAGQAEAFKTTALATGPLASLAVYIPSGSASTRLTAAIYGDNVGHAGMLLASGSLSAPTANAWNTVSLTSSPQITSGTTYWIAVLSPVGAGTLAFRDAHRGGATEMSSQTNLSAFPATWTRGATYTDGPVSAYGVAATVAPDTTPPSSPTAFAALAVTQTGLSLSWGASSDNVGVAGYDVFRNGVKVGSMSSTGTTWSGLVCGTTYAAAVDAYDAAGNTSAATQITVTTAACPDTTPPSSPSGLVQSASTGTSVSVTWQASTDNVGVTGYDTFLDGASRGSVTATSTTLSGLLCGTSYSVAIAAYDAAGNRSTQGSVPAVTRACDAPPTAKVTGPTPGSTVSGTITVTADATDDVGVAAVQFKLDGTNLGTEDTTDPYSTSWDTTAVSDGTHTLTATARDTAGATTTSVPVSVTVSNTAGNPTPTAVPARNVDGVTVGGGFIEASARQVIRTANNVVYVIAADDNPCQGGGSGVIRVEKGLGAQAANAAVPTSFAEQDAANHPVSAGSSSCQYSSGSVIFNPDSRLDRNGVIHMAYIDAANGNVYYQTFSTITDKWGSRVVLATNGLRISGGGWPRGGQVALTLDVNDAPHVVYATSGTTNSIACLNKVSGAWSAAVTISSGTDLMHPSLVTSLDGALHLAWLTNALAVHSGVAYARYDGISWSPVETVSAGDGVVLANGDDDQGPSVATDLQSRPHVLYLDGSVNGSDNYVRMRVRTAPNTWVDNTPPGGQGGASNPAGTWFTHTPQNYVSNAGTDFVFLGHDVNISPGGYEYQVGGAGNPWSPYATLDPRDKSNTTAGAPGLDGSASIRFDPLRETNAGIIDLVYFDEYDGTAGYPHHSTIYYKAIVIGSNDTVSPTTPTGLVRMGATATSLTLAWNAAADNVAVAGYGLYNGSNLVASTTATSATLGGLTCETTYSVSVDAFDAAGNRSGRATISATTGNCDRQAPTVVLTAPAPGSTVSGAVTVSASASDDIGVAGVQFTLDGTNLGAEDTQPPYAVTWDSATASSGQHVLTAIAHDAAGNVTASSPVTVSTQNASPAFVKDLGGVTAVNTGGSLQLPIPAGGVAAGHTIVVWGEMSGGSSVTIASIVDSRGNTYTADAAINNQGVNTMVGSGYVATPLLQGDKVTVTFSGSYYSVRVLRAAEFTGLASVGRVGVKATATGTSTAPSTPSAAVQTSELVIGAVGTNSTSSFTPAAGFSALPAGSTTGSGVTRTVIPIYRVVSVGGQYQVKGTLAASSMWSAALVTYH